MRYHHEEQRYLEDHPAGHRQHPHRCSDCPRNDLVHGPRPDNTLNELTLPGKSCRHSLPVPAAFSATKCNKRTVPLLYEVNRNHNYSQIIPPYCNEMENFSYLRPLKDRIKRYESDCHPTSQPTAGCAPVQ